ncbi:glutamyl-tRNA reductase [Anoxynatronum buryatiense]|uniref:Glutamyl-tRNA reductase n=1 Tax=Anoxynatronum buryatiense TaxID=489973 RepID=A0AA45WX83_9CLOT|nr:glutamyl-tRNA reductase [Anoxynatronum buryatiense]SMP61489.1 glutamyl-tRNA reductase [Anoxynatronum buryatiense]
MNLIIFGLHYQKTPLTIRERAVFRSSEMEHAYARLLQSQYIEGGVILSTCNRSQLICHVSDLSAAATTLFQFYLDFFHFSKDELSPCCQTLTGREAVSHFFETCCGLNSLVLGEDQILGQVKEAWFNARDFQATNKVLNRLFQEGITLGKKVRAETKISETPLSVASIAVRMGQQFFTDLSDKRVLVIGRGEMARLALNHLGDTAVSEIYVSSRQSLILSDLEKRRRLIPVSYEDRYRIAAGVDWVISATAAPHIVFEKNAFLREYRGHALLLTDIALPRDIDPALSKEPTIQLYDLDMLETVAQEGMEHRYSQLSLIRQRLNEAMKQFEEWWHCLPVFPRIQAIQEYSHALTTGELKQLFQQMPHLTPGDQEQITAFVFSLTKKMWRTPIHQLKQEGLEGRGEAAGALLDRLLNKPEPHEEILPALKGESQ